jgi:tRNA1(Val) A37 N6-methylase TrmN6
LWPGGETRKPAKRVIVQGHRGSAAPLSLVEGLVLHQPNGHFTDGAERVLRHAGALIW